MQRPLQAPMAMPRNPGMAINPFLNQQNPGPMDPSGTFQMGFGNMVPDAQTLAQLQQPLPQLDEFGFQKMIPSIPSVQPIMGQPLVPGSATPQPQTGLSAAELLELSDEELQRYIPRENIGYGVGANARSIDSTPSPEDFRNRLQAEMNLKPGDRGYGMLQQQTYRPIDSSPSTGSSKDKQLSAVPGVGAPQQLLPPPPGFVPPTIGNTGGSGRDMGIAPPSFGGGRPPIESGGQPLPAIDPFVPRDLMPTTPPMAPPAMKQPVAPLAPPIDKRGDFMSIAQDPNALPLEDRGFGPGITRTPDFMRPGSGEDVYSVDRNPMQLPVGSITANMARLYGGTVSPGSAPVPPPPTSGMPFQPVQAVNPQPAPFVPPQQPAPSSLSQNTNIFGEGKRYDPGNLPEGFSFDAPTGGGQAYDMGMPPAGFVYAYGQDGKRQAVPSGAAGAAEMREQGAARDQQYLDFTKNNPGKAFGLGFPPGLPQAPTGTPPERFSINQLNPFEPEPTMFTPPQNPATAPTPPAAPAPVVPPVVAPPVPVTPPQSTAAATNTTAPAPVPAPTPAPVPTPAPATTTPATTTPANDTTTTPGTTMAQPQSPYVSNLIRNETGMDATTKQLLFGLDGKGGFIPGAMQASENTFFNPDGTPRVVAEQVAGLSPDQLAAQQMTRQSVGMQDPYLAQAQDAYTTGIGQLGQGLEAAQLRGQQALDTTRLGVAQEEALRRQGLGATLGGLGQGARLATDATTGLAGQLGGVEDIQRSAADRFQQQAGGVGLNAMGATDQFGNRLGESESLLRGTTGAYDPSMTQQFYDPYEDAVVDQVSKDLFKQYDRGDISARASDIARGGESAFGSRARLGAGERAEALGRGLADAIGGIRSRGFQQAQQTGLSEFARQRDAERAAASGLSGFAGARLGAQQQLGSTLSGLSGDQLAAQQNLASGLGNLAGQRYQAGTNLGSTLAGYGSQAGSALGGAGQSALGSANQLAGAYGTMGGLQGSIGQQQQQAMFGLGSNLQGLGQQAQGAMNTDIGNLYGMGQGQQQQYQAQLDAARRNALTAQQAPLAQYQALAPFIQMAPQGQFNTQTTFAPRPSALQAGLATGLGTLGAVGNFMRPPS